MKESTMKNRKKRISLLVLGNAVLIVLFLVLSVLHVRRNLLDDRAAAEQAFVSNVSSMRSVATTVLVGEQTSAGNRARYIDLEGMNMEEALKLLAESTVESDVMIHIVDYDTHTGYSSVADSAGNNEVSYATFWSTFASQADLVRSGADEGEITLTGTFTNPITHKQAVGFLENVTIAEDGAGKDYLLIWVLDAKTLQARWDFPGQYSDAELSLIMADGKYVMKTATLKNENFWEFVRTYNNLGYDETDALMNRFYSGETDIEILKDSNGQSIYTVLVPFSDTNSEIYYVAILPVDSLATATTDYGLVIIVGCGLLSLLLFNALYMLEMNSQLRRSNALALEASRAKTDFLSSMSHDIRTPMNAIIGMTEIASRNVDDPEKVEDCLNKISMSSNHLLTLINDILDISKIESGRLSLNPAVLSLRNVVETEVNVVQTQVARKKQTLDVKLDNLAYEYVLADELRLKQVFINILSNAVKYTDEGGHIELELSDELAAVGAAGGAKAAKAEPATAAESTGDAAESASEQQVLLTYRVTDNGQGMDEEFLKVMYEPFTRMTDSRTNQTQGTGLGLAITKRMVDLMDGEITCESAVGVGTTFTVRLHLPLAEKPASEESKRDEAGGLSGLKLLVAEDNDMNWEIIHELLMMNGISSERAENGQIAVEMVENAEPGSFDAILMDVHMPVMDGLVATRVIRSLSDEERKNIPIIAMTADAFAEDVTACLDAGMNAHTAKPVDMNKLLAVLDETVQK